jgi:hypothetical protein
MSNSSSGMETRPARRARGRTRPAEAAPVPRCASPGRPCRARVSASRRRATRCSFAPSFFWLMYRGSASSSDASRMSVTWSAAASACFGGVGLLACVAHMLHRQDDEGGVARKASAAADSHRPVVEFGPAVGALDPATDALLDGALGSRP